MVSRDAAEEMSARRRFRRIGATISYPYTASSADFFETMCGERVYTRYRGAFVRLRKNVIGRH